MVKLGPDLYTGSDSYSGYQPSGNFTGFSMLHESGTGGAPKYGVVSQLPALGDIANPLAYPGEPRASADVTKIGYYKSNLASGITVELGATERAGYYKHTFPETDESLNIIVDVSHVLPSFRGMGLEQHYLGGGISVSDDKVGLSYEGWGKYDNVSYGSTTLNVEVAFQVPDLCCKGWNRSPGWTVYFCGYFDEPGSFNTFLGADSTSDTLVQYDTTSQLNSTARLGAIFSFDSTTVTSRVGVSFISTEQACQNVNSQIPAGTSLSQLTDNTREAWNDQVLSKVTTTDTDTSKLQLLYSSLYFMQLLPQNKTGENPLWTSSEPYYDDTFTLWDLVRSTTAALWAFKLTISKFRCTTPLLHILQPVVYEEYIRSLIDIYRNDGYMPDGRSSFWNGATQGGSNADNVLADAYVKGVQGKIDWEDGYKAMVQDAEVQPPNNNDPRDRTSSTKEGRGALPDWIDLGYITPTYARSVSRAVE